MSKCLDARIELNKLFASRTSSSDDAKRLGVSSVADQWRAPKECCHRLCPAHGFEGDGVFEETGSATGP